MNKRKRIDISVIESKIIWNIKKIIEILEKYIIFLKVNLASNKGPFGYLAAKVRNMAVNVNLGKLMKQKWYWIVGDKKVRFLNFIARTVFVLIIDTFCMFVQSS